MVAFRNNFMGISEGEELESVLSWCEMQSAPWRHCMGRVNSTERW